MVVFGRGRLRYVAAAEVLTQGPSMGFSSSVSPSYRLYDLDSLRCHERTIPPYLELLTREIADDDVLKYPIVIDGATRTILDGHHRYRALRRLGCTSIPAFAVDYSDPGIRVGSWRGGVVSKGDVLRAGLSGRLLPPKTSRHFLPFLPVRADTPLQALVKKRDTRLREK